MNTESTIKEATKPACFLGAVTCRFSIKKIRSGTYLVKIGEHEYEIYNHGYYAPDKCVWWEATNLKTNEADFHENTKRELLRTMLRELS
jgi:hypothetical protein